MKKSPNFWYENNFSSRIKIFVLFPLSVLWSLVSKIKHKYTNKYETKLKVICIGNLTIGGTGKTPFVIYTYKVLKNLGYKPVFLTRGYKGLLHGPIEVKDSHSYKEVGDEALLLSKVGHTVVSKNRSLGAKLIEKHKENFNIILMDDGLQNYQLKKDISCLLIDTNLQFGNGYCIPAGPLREPVNQGLKKIDIIIFTGQNKEPNYVFKNVKSLPVLYSEIKIRKPAKVKQDKLLAFCGLANPNKFYQTLNDNGFKVVSTKSFPDHYKYKDQDINDLILEAKSKKLKLITTEKDYVKINHRNDLINVLPIRINLNQEQNLKFKKFLKEKLND